MSIKYILNLIDGTIINYEKELFKEDANLLKNYDYNLIHILSKEEFINMSENFPYKKFLYKSMNPIIQCKLEVYNECIFGTMYIPYDKDNSIKAYAFSYYFYKNEMYFIDEVEFIEKCIDDNVI